MPLVKRKYFFPEDQFRCSFEGKTNSPLVVSPRYKTNLIAWAKNNQEKVASAIKEYGAVVFSGFDLTKEDFPKLFTAVVGMPPQVYQGDTPRDEIGSRIYKSTALLTALPPHQEVSNQQRAKMPAYISFYCETPPKVGTGQTLVANVERISRKIEKLKPQLWHQMKTKTLTYTARYLPEANCPWWIRLLTKWIGLLNPSHGTIKRLCGTEDRKEVERKCREAGFTYEWDKGWLVTKRTGIPAVIKREGKFLYCNQVHLNVLNEEMCGGRIPYWIARCLLYPTKRYMQFDVEFSDGTQISRKDAGDIVALCNKEQQGRSWKKGDALFVDNVNCMHAKTRHLGLRKILVAMGGSV